MPALFITHESTARKYTIAIGIAIEKSIPIPIAYFCAIYLWVKEY